MYIYKGKTGYKGWYDRCRDGKREGMSYLKFILKAFPM